MDFKEKKNRLENFDYNVKHCLRNEITSKITVINDFRVDTIDDAGQLFNMACTKIFFKDYLENNNMKVSELQPILNDVYASFINDNSSKKPKTKKSSFKSSSRKTTVEADTENNISNKVVSINNDSGVQVAKITNQKLKNNI